MIFDDIDFEPGWHVIPADDLKEHKSTIDCWCRPYLDCASDGLVYIHQSLDGREREVN